MVLVNPALRGSQDMRFQLYNRKGRSQSLSHVQPWSPQTVTHQAPLSMGFFRQEYWSRLPFPSPGDPPDPGIKPGSTVLQADSLPPEPPGKPQQTGTSWSAYSLYCSQNSVFYAFLFPKCVQKKKSKFFIIILGWPQSSFGFFHKVENEQTVANPI